MGWIQVSLVLLVFVAYHSDLSGSGTVEGTLRPASQVRAPAKSLSTPVLERFRRSINHEGHTHRHTRTAGGTGPTRTCRSTDSGARRLRTRCPARSSTNVPTTPRRPLSQRCPRRQLDAGRRTHYSWCNRTCFTECWGDWSDWSACSATCGNAGFQEASRSVSPSEQCEDWTVKYGCPGPTTRTQSCNRFCHNGGTPQAAHCECPNGFSGTCCETRVTCGDPGQPENGAVSPSSTTHNYGTTVTYTCNTGFQLRGEATRTCQQSGIWDGQLPTCVEISCGEPGEIEHGGRTVTGTTHPSGRVTYTCIAGHYMQGDDELACEVNGQWSAATPTCHSCGRNEYKAGSNAAKSCEPCPANSHTVSTGSHALELCICDQGFSGPNGGPCTAITCPTLTAPQDGVLGACGSIYQDVCTMECREGYVQASGDAERRCELNGQWSGDPLVCSPCDEDTYKSGPLTCRRCPPDTHTDGQGHGLAGCTCDPGFQGPGGGPCDDIDECTTEQGGCEQACVNEPGSYRCECPNPGFIVDAENPHACTARNECPELEAVANGGHVCVMQTGTNTERCEVKCNSGYEHVLPPNLWEECGPSTDWKWSSDLRDIPLLPCQKAFFEGIILEAEVFYFVDQCSELTAEEIEAVQMEFLTFLQSQAICTDSGPQACSFEDVTLECGEVGFGARRRRETRQQLKFTFKIVVDAKEAEEVDCKTLCDRPDASDRYCDLTCAENYQQNMTASLAETVEDTLAARVQRPGGEVGESVSEEFTLAGLTLIPQGIAAVTSTETACGTGMARQEGICVPCPPGTRLHEGACQMCSIFTYQPEPRQTSCLTCLWAAVPGLSRCRNPLEIIEDVIEEVVEGN